MHVCLCVWGGEWGVSCPDEAHSPCQVRSSTTLHLIFRVRVSRWVAFTGGHSWQESLLQGPSCLGFPVLGCTGMHCCTWLLRQVLGIHTQFPRLAWQTPYPGSHLPSPQRFIVWGTAGFRWGCGDLTGHDLHAKGSYGAGSWCSRKGF